MQRLRMKEVWQDEEAPTLPRVFFWKEILSVHVDDMTPPRRGVRFWYIEDE